MITRGRPTSFLAACVALVLATPAHAQLGGLRKAVEKAAGKKAEETAKPGQHRATATIEWTADSRLVRSTVEPFTETVKEQGTLTAVLEIAPEALPGGPMSQAMSDSGGYAIIAGGTYSGITGNATLVSASGSVTYDMQHDDTFAASCNGQVLANPRKENASGRLTFDAERTAFQLHFRGEKPIGVQLPVTLWVKLTRRITSACRPPETLSDSLPHAFAFPNLELAATGWTFEQGGGPGRYTLVARHVSVDSTNPGTRIAMTVKLTWEGPPAPKGAVAEAPPVRQPTLTTGRGSVTFTQGGKDATWALADVVEAMAGGMGSRSYVFTSDGKTMGAGKGLFTLTLVKIGADFTFASINVVEGPAGDSDYETDSNKCTLRLTPQAGGGVSGTGQCSGGFSGAPVTKFTFTAK